MDNINLDKKLKNDIFSADTQVALTALNIIRESGNKSYLPILFDLLLSFPEKEFDKEIKNVLGTIKQKDTIPVFIEALKKIKYKPIRKTILTTCWQNGLDFREYLLFFTELIIEEDWETGFEAFTLIENFKELPEKKIIEKTIEKINNSIESAGDRKKYFLQEILYKIQ